MVGVEEELLNRGIVGRGGGRKWGVFVVFFGGWGFRGFLCIEEFSV